MHRFITTVWLNDTIPPTHFKQEGAKGWEKGERSIACALNRLFDPVGLIAGVGGVESEPRGLAVLSSNPLLPEGLSAPSVWAALSSFTSPHSLLPK